MSWKPTLPEAPDYCCRQCGSQDILYRDQDDIHGDIEYHCQGCGRRWWFEGADY